MAGKPRTYPGTMSSAYKTQNCGAPWNSKRIANSHQPKLHRDGGKKWFFPSPVNEAAHIEMPGAANSCSLWPFLFDLSSIPRILYEVIAEFHALKLGITLTRAEILTFFACRPDGVAFNAKDTEQVFLEFTRPMDSVTPRKKGVGRNERKRRNTQDMPIIAISSTIWVLKQVGSGNAHRLTSR